MGGVLRINNILKMYMDGEPLQGMFMGGREVWKKPLRSMYPSRLVDTSDNILFLGSSDVGCLLGTTWHPVRHNWPNVFRSNYTGDFVYPYTGENRYGMAAAVTYGRVSTPQVIENARNGMYADQVNPFISLGDYDTLVIDTSDLGPEFRLGGFSGEDEALISDYYRYTRMPLPYLFGQFDHQNWLNHEFEIRMELLRLCSQNGVRKLFLMTPWPRLFGEHADQTPAGDVLWYNRFFQNLEDSMHYQQDRLNQQIEFEGLTTHVTLIPMHLMVKRIYEGIADGTAPSIMTSIRSIFAHSSNLLTEPSPLDDSIHKHWYMLNYYGAYAINCLFAAVAYKVDPRGYPRTDGAWTVDADSAAYFQELAWDIAQTYGRAGQTRSNPGFIMPTLRPDPRPAGILGNGLLLHAENVDSGSTINTVREDTVRHVVGVVEVDRGTASPTGDIAYAFRFAGSGNMGAMLSFTLDETGRFDLRGGYGDNAWGTEVSTALRLGFMNAPASRTGTVKVFFDVPMPYGDSTVYLGVHNHRLIATDVDAESNDRSYKTLGHYMSAGGLDPIANRMIVDNPGIRILDIIAVDHHMNDYEYQNILRYLSKKHRSSNIMEPLTPDMVRRASGPRQPSLSGERSIHSGHSLTDAYFHSLVWPGSISLILEALGYADPYDSFIKATIPGSPAWWRWEYPIEGQEDPVRNPDLFDTLVITDVNNPLNIANIPSTAETLDYFCRFAANQIVNGRGNEVILWSVWGDLLGGYNAPFQNLTFRELLDVMEDSYRFLADYTTWKMHQEYPDLLDEDWRVWLIPGHRWMIRTYEDAALGLVPDITEFEDLFSDTVHASDQASFGLSVFVLTAMTQRYLGDVPGVGQAATNAGVSPAMAQYFYDIAWDICTTFEPVGMGGEEGADKLWNPDTMVDPNPNWTFSNPTFEPSEPGEDPEEPGTPPAGVILVHEETNRVLDNVSLTVPLDQNIVAGSPVYAAFIVEFPAGSPENAHILAVSANNNSTYSLHFQKATNSINLDVDPPGGHAAAPPSIPDETPVFIEGWVQSDGAYIRHSDGGINRADYKRPLNSESVQIHFGRHPWGTEPITATIHALRVYQGVPDESERAAIRTWLEAQVP